ncbi:MAG: HD domain-containing protein [Sulfurimonas sp.]|nr:HD domain-containing protein [Sulfurimonas sp.]
MNKPSIKSITIKKLIRFFLVFAIVLSTILAINFRDFAQETVEKKAFAIADMVKAGLTSHMKANIMDKKEYFINEIASTYDVDSIAIIRSDNVINQFGLENNMQKGIEDDIRVVFETKKPLFNWNEFSDSVKIRAIVPYIATSQDALSCVSCHNVEVGEILGAIDMQIDATSYRDLTIIYVGMIALSILLFSIFVITNMFKVINKHISKPLHKLIFQAREAHAHHSMIDSNFYDSYEMEDVATNINKFSKDILKKQDELENKNKELLYLNEEIEGTLREILIAMGKLEEVRSSETKNHTTRVVKLTKLLSEKLRLSDENIKVITIAAPIHDIGKVAISDKILNKPAKLTEEEFEIMKKHVDYGFLILKHSNREIIKAAMHITYEHHEKYDGSGYPNSLKGEEIHIFARIVSLVDVFDALSSKRCYKEVWSKEKVIEYIANEKGKHFDPVIADVFLNNVDEFYKIIEDNC